MQNVATLAQQRQIRSAINHVTKDVNKLSNNIMTGKKHNSFAEVKPNELRFSEDLINRLETAENRLKNNSLLSSKIGEYENTIRRMQSLLSSASRFIQTVANPINRNNLQGLGVVQVSNQYMSEVRGLLNKTFNGEYIFAGSMINIAPVADPTTTSNVMPDGTITSNYYLGDDYSPTLKISDTQILNYGITADNKAFQNFFAAFQYTKLYYTNGGQSNITQALSLLQETQDGLGQLLASIGENSKVVERAIEEDSDNIVRYTRSIAEMLNIDPSLEFEKLPQRIAQLQAIYMVAAKSEDMWILPYLK